MESTQFPSDFTWGTATSAHQTEGNNTNSDWWQWERTKDTSKKFPEEPSNEACDSYNRFEDDFELCRQLNNNGVRISVEWARIEPEEGKFNQIEIDHYKKVLNSAKSKGLKTFVTLQHFTLPMWLSKKGGWLNSQSPKYFAEYASVVAKELDILIDFYMTINEPQVLILMGYINGLWAPGKKNFWYSIPVQINLLRAHIAGYKNIKSLSNKPVGIVHNVVWHQPSKNWYDKIWAAFLNFGNRDTVLMPINKYNDFIGLNYYFTNYVNNLKVQNPREPASDLGWWIDFNGLEKILISLKMYNRPIYITENGLADASDDQRQWFIKNMLTSCLKALDKGANLKGYFYWSLIDNYEWHNGFWPRFGLVRIDREDNLRRVPRPSFYYYSNICKTGNLD